MFNGASVSKNTRLCGSLARTLVLEVMGRARATVVACDEVSCRTGLWRNVLNSGFNGHSSDTPARDVAEEVVSDGFDGVLYTFRRCPYAMRARMALAQPIETPRFERLFCGTSPLPCWP